MAGNGYKSGSNLEMVLAAGEFAVTAELGPPKSAHGHASREVQAWMNKLEAWNAMKAANPGLKNQDLDKAANALRKEGREAFEKFLYEKYYDIYIKQRMAEERETKRREKQQ